MMLLLLGIVVCLNLNYLCYDDLHQLVNDDLCCSYFGLFFLDVFFSTFWFLSFIYFIFYFEKHFETKVEIRSDFSPETHSER